jgi:hypothetical protein
METTGDAPPNELPPAAGAARPSRRTVHRLLLERVERVEQALRHWDGWEAEVERDVPRRLETPPRPALTRPALQELHALLLKQITRIPAPASTHSGTPRRGPTEPGT